MSSGMTKAKDALCLKTDLVTGTTVSGDITVTGITEEDTLLYCEKRIVYAATVDETTDVTDDCSITDDDTIQCTTNTSTNGVAGTTVSSQGKLFVRWADNDA